MVTVLGTRPEIIRLSRIIATLDANLEHRIVHTGQNYDFELNEIFFRDLEIRKPDYFLNVDTSSLGKVLGGVIVETEKILEQERPDAVLILGDTNSSLAAIIAKRMKITVYHLEAGNRSFDDNVPEEINRRIIDHVADFNLAYTEHARRNLLAEGLHSRRVYVIGSPLREVFEYYLPRIESSNILERLGLERGKYFVVSAHREENVDNRELLQRLLEALCLLSDLFKQPIIVSTHPRTQRRIAALGDLRCPERIRFLKPLGFLDYNCLQASSACVLSDSGSVGEECAILPFPAVTIRNSMERPEAMETGSLIITGVDPDRIVSSVQVAMEQHAAGHRPEVPADYLIRNSSQRVLNLITGTARLDHVWKNLAVHERFWE